MEKMNISVGQYHLEPNAPPMYPGLQQINIQPQDLVMQRQPSADLHFQQTMPMETLKVPQSATERPGTAVILMNNSAPIAVGHEPQRISCPHCGVKVQTRLDYRSTFRTHVAAVLFCVTGFICCAPLPYCMNSCKSLDHYCSNCDQFIGSTNS